MPIDCQKCGEPNSSRLRICRSCGANLHADIQPRQTSCAECSDKNPVHRQAHWMDYERDGLRGHLLENFTCFSARLVDLNHKLGEISDYRDRYYHKFADDYGQWLSPGRAYLERMRKCDRIVGMAEGYSP